MDIAHRVVRRFIATPLSRYDVVLLAYFELSPEKRQEKSRPTSSTIKKLHSFGLIQSPPYDPDHVGPQDMLLSPKGEKLLADYRRRGH
jgi:hypothetical protein